MKIVTWNVNSLNVRLKHVLKYLAEEKPDILALQETKLPDERFPAAEIEAMGYHAVFSGQKTYNGVAVLSREEIADPISALPGLEDAQKRLLACAINGIRLINVYVPNGQEVGSEKYEYKFRWLGALREWLRKEIERYPRLVVLGDFNIAPADIDVHDPKRWREKIMCSTKEREMFRSLLALGLRDVLRELYPEEPLHSWWDYRLNAFQRRWGLRIDLQLATPAMQAIAGGVDIDFRGLDRPSDHAPVWVEYR